MKHIRKINESESDITLTKETFEDSFVELTELCDSNITFLTSGFVLPRTLLPYTRHTLSIKLLSYSIKEISEIFNTLEFCDKRISSYYFRNKSFDNGRFMITYQHKNTLPVQRNIK